MNKKCFLIALLISLIFVLIYYLFPNFLLALELKAYDSFTRLSKNLKSPSSHLNEIVIVALDDFSFKKMQKKWPFSRSIYAELLNKIDQGYPRLVIFDVVFSGEGKDKEGDNLFAQTLRNKNNILLPYHVGKLGANLKSKKEFVAEFASAGYLNKPIDNDGSIRRFQPFRLSVKERILDYAVELYVFSRYYNYDLKNVIFKNKHLYLSQLTDKKDMLDKFDFCIGTDKSIMINYQADIKDFTIVPLWSIYSGSIALESFRNKVVLIGATSHLFHDIHDTPLGLMPGIGVLANAILMFLDGSFIHETPGWIRWLMMFVLCFSIVFLCYRCPIFKGLLLTGVIIIILATSTFLLFLNNYYLNPFKLILICIVSYIAINFYKYASVVIENMHLRKLSTIDELTGLYIFRYFKIVLKHEFQKSLRYKTPLSLLMIDIDNFKKINDTYGHQNGNVVLSKIGKIILNTVRGSDVPVRYGGEELAVLLPNSGIEGAKKCAENLRSLVEKEDFVMTEKGPLRVTISIGAVSFPSTEVSSGEEMIKFADEALYTAKSQGKNRVIVFEKKKT